MNTEALFSTGKGDWGTPFPLFNEMDREFGFTVDVCATPENRKVQDYWSPEDDGLAHSWSGHRCWMNPPYGNSESPCKPGCKKKICEKRGYHIDKYVPGIEDWTSKACHEADPRRGDPALVVALLPARTDTSWWHNNVMKANEVRFIRGRLIFQGAEGPAPFPSVIVIWRQEGFSVHGGPIVHRADAFGRRVN